MKEFSATDFIPLNLFEGLFPVKTDLVYAQPDHKDQWGKIDNHFPNLYDPDAKLLWVHKDLLPVVLLAAKICEERYGWSLNAHDCLRPVEAQAKMEGYGYPEELVSTPGKGAHPRGMAVDLIPAGVNMGTPYDYFADDLNNNPAARNAVAFPRTTHEEAAAINERRQNFEDALTEAAQAFGHTLYPLAEEWWDFRFMAGIPEKDGAAKILPTSTTWGAYKPVSEGVVSNKQGQVIDTTILPGYMKLVGKPDPAPADVQATWPAIVENIRQAVQEKFDGLGPARGELSQQQALKNYTK